MSHKVPDVHEQAGAEEYDETIYETIYESIYETYLEDDLPPTTEPALEAQRSLYTGTGKPLGSRSDRSSASLEAMLVSTDPTTKAMGLDALRDSNDHDTRTKLAYAFQCLDDTDMIITDAAIQLLRVTVEDDPLPLLQDAYETTTKEFHDAVIRITSDIVFRSQKMADASTSILSMLTQVHLDLALFILTQMMNGFRQKNIKNVEVTSNVLRKLELYIDRAIDSSALVEFPGTLIKSIADSLTVALKTKGLGIKEIAEDYILSLTHIIPSDLLLAEFTKNKLTSVKGLTSTGNTPGPVSRPITRPPPRSQSQPKNAHQSSSYRESFSTRESDNLLSRTTDSVSGSGVIGQEHAGEGLVASQQSFEDQIAGASRQSFADHDDSLTQPSDSFSRTDELKYVYTPPNFDPDTEDWISMMYIPRSILPGITDGSWQVRKEALETTELLFNPFIPHPQPSLTLAQCENRKNNKTISEEILMRINEVVIGDQNIAVVIAALGALRIMLMYLPSSYYSSHSKREITESILQKLKSRKPGLLAPCYNAIDVILGRFLTLEELIELPILQNALPEVPRDVIDKISTNCSFKAFLDQTEEYIKNDKRPIPPSKSALNTYLYIEFCRLLQRQMAFLLFLLLGGIYKKPILQSVVPNSVMELLCAYATSPNIVIKLDLSESFQAMLAGMGTPTPLKPKEINSPSFTLSLKMESIAGLSSLRYYPLSFVAHLCRGFFCEKSLYTLSFIKICTGTLMRDMSSEVRSVSKEFDGILNTFMSLHRSVLKQKSGGASRGSSPTKKAGAHTPSAAKNQNSGQTQTKPIQIAVHPTDSDLLDFDPKKPSIQASLNEFDPALGRAPIDTSNASNASQRSDPLSSPDKPKTPQRASGKAGARSGTPGKMKTPVRSAQNQPPQIIGTAGKTKFIYYHAYDFPAEVFRTCSFDSGTNFKRVKIMLRPPSFLLYKIGPVCTSDDLAFVETLNTPKYDFSLIFQPAHTQEPREGTFYVLQDGERAYSYIEPLVDQFSLIITKTFMASSQKKAAADKGQNLASTVVSIFRIIGMLIMTCNNEGTLIKILPAAGIILNTIYSKDLGLYNTIVSAYIYHILTFIPYRLTSSPAKVITAWKKLLTVSFDIHGLVPVYYTLFAIMAAICKELENEDGELNIRNGQYILTLGEYLHEVVKFLHDKFDPVHSAAGFSLRVTSELLIHILELGAYLYGGCPALTGPSGLLVRVSSKLLAMLVYFLRNVNGLEQMDPVFLGKVLDCEVIPTLKGLYSSGAFEAACMYSALNCLRTIRDADSELARYIQAVLTCCNKTDFPRLTLSTRAPKTCMQLDVEADRGKIHNCDFRKPTNLYTVIRDLSVKNPGIYDALAIQGLVSIQKYAVASDKSLHQPVKPMHEQRESKEQRGLTGGEMLHNVSLGLNDGGLQDGRKQRYSVDECMPTERASLDGDRSIREKPTSSRPSSARSRQSISHRDSSSMYDDEQDTNQTFKHEKDRVGKSDAHIRQRAVLHHTIDSAMKAHQSAESLDNSLQQEDASSALVFVERTSVTDGDRERSTLKKATSTPLRKIASSMRSKSSTILQMKLSNIPEFLQPYYKAPGFELPLNKVLGVLSEYESALSAEKDSMIRSDLTIAMIQALSLYEDHSIDSTKISRKLLQSIDEKVHTESNANAGDYYLLLMTELARTGTVLSVFEQAWSIGLINMLGMTRRPITRSYAVQALNMCMNSHVILTATTIAKSYMGGSILKALNGTSASYSITSPTAGIIATIKQETLNWILSDMLPSIISFVSESEVFYTFESSAVLHQIWTQCEDLAANSKSTAMRGTANEILHMLQQVQAACKEQEPKKPVRPSKPNREEILGKELAQTINELEKTTRYNSKNTDDVIKQALSAERNRLSQPPRGSIDANTSSICSEDGFSTTAIYLGGLSAAHAPALDDRQSAPQNITSARSTMSKPAIPRHGSSARQSVDVNEGFESVQNPAKSGSVRKESTDSYMVDDLNEPSFRSVANSSLLERHSEPIESRNISHSSRSSLSQNYPSESFNALSAHGDSTMTKSSLAIILHNVYIPFSGRHEHRFAAACKLVCDSSCIISLLTPYIFERQASISATDIRVVRHVINESILNSDITAPMIDLNGVDPNSLIPIRSVHFNEEDVHNGILAILKQYKMEIGATGKYSKESIQAFSSVSLLYSALALSNDFVTEGWRPLASTVATVCKCIGTLCKYIRDLRDFKILVGPLLVRLTMQPSYQEKLAIQKTLDALFERHQIIEEEYLKTPGKRIIRHFLQNYMEVFDDNGANIHLKYTTLKVITEYLEMIIEGIDDFQKVQPIIEPWLLSVTAFFKRLCIVTFKKSCKVSDEFAGKAFMDYVKTEFKDPAITVEYINSILDTKEHFLLALYNLSGAKTVNSFRHFYRAFMDKLSLADADLVSTWLESVLNGQTLRIDIKEATMVTDMFSPGTNEYVEYDIISINESMVDDLPVSLNDTQDASSRRATQSQLTPTLTNSVTHAKDGTLSNDPLVDAYSTSPRKGQRTDMDALLRDAEQVLGQSLRQSLSARAVAESMQLQPKQHDAIEGDNDMVELFTRMGTLVTDVDVDLLDEKVTEELRSSKLYKNRSQQKDMGRNPGAAERNPHESMTSVVPPLPAALSSYTVPSLSLDEASSFNADTEKGPYSLKLQDGRAANPLASAIVDHAAEKSSANPSPSKEISVVKLRDFPSTDRFVSLAKSTEGLPLAVAGVVDQIDYKFKTLDTIERLQSAARLCDSTLTEAMSFTLKSLTDSMTGTIIKTFSSENMRKLVDTMLYIKRQLTVSLQDDTTMMLFITRIVSFLQNYLSNPSFRGLVQAKEFHDLQDIPADLGKNKPSFYGEDIAFEAIKQVQRSISSLSGTGLDPVRISMLTLLIEDCLTLLTLIIDGSSATHLIKALIRMFTVIYEEGLLVYRASEFPLLRPYYTTSHSIVQNILNSLLDKLTQIVAHAPQDFSQDISRFHAEFLAKKEVPQAASAFSGTLFSIFLILSGSLSMYPNVNNKQHSSYSLTSGHSSCPSELTFLYPRPCIITCIKRLTDDLDTAARDTLSTVCGLEIVSQLGSL